MLNIMQKVLKIVSLKGFLTSSSNAVLIAVESTYC